MPLYLDSADPEDARRAASLGFVRGATTNPVLVAKSGLSAEQAVPQLCDILPGIVFHQLTADSTADRADEARRIVALRPGRIGLKIPCTLDNLSLAATLSAEGYIVGITAIFHPSQVLLAAEAGADYILPYVNRSTRLLGDGPLLVSAMRRVIEATGAPTEIIAASVKSPEEAVVTVDAGAHHLTLPLAVIEQAAHHDLSVEAIRDFGVASSA